MRDKTVNRKLFSNVEAELDTQSGDFYFSGYANTKNKPDAYGDIPFSLNGKPVYELTRYKKNPVILVDHVNSASSIAGTMVELREDDFGLFFRAKLRREEDIHSESVLDAVKSFKTGFSRALSIAGMWSYEDRANPNHLTSAYIHEISIVAIPADEDSLSSTVAMPKNLNISKEPQARTEVETLSSLISQYRESKSDDTLKQIYEVIKNGRV